MSTSEVRRYTSEIVSIDPSLLISYTYSKNEIKLNKLEKSDKNAFFISYLQARDMITTTIDISRNIPDSDIKDAIEIKVYDELALDTSIEYSIHYLEVEAKDTKNRSFNVFIVDAAMLKAKLAPMRERIRYVDYVTPVPFLIKALYKKNFIEPEGTHCFVYFQKNDAFLTIYKGGEYLYSKSLHYSLKEITEKFCELIGERIEEEDFYRLLVNDGLRVSNTQYQQSLMQLFGEIFLYINDVLVFCKRSYDIEYVDKVYLGSEVGTFSGIDEYSKSYLGLESFEFNFSIAINSKEWYIDQIHILMMLSAQLYLENPDELLNFSIFKRPPPLKERPAGQLLAILLIGLVVGFAYPLYQLSYSLFLSLKAAQDTSAYNDLYQKTSHIRQELSALKTEKDKVDTLLKEESNKLEFRKKLLSEIYQKKISYPMKAAILVEIFELSNQNGCKVESIDFHGKQLDFYVLNRSEKRITEFIQDLTELKKYKVNTDKILQNEETRLYSSKISIGLNNE